MSLPLPPVLVVDDEKNMRLSLETILGDANYPVRSVESAEDALKVLAEQELLMVITDARLGGMSGYELLKRLHTQRPDLPVLMITAHVTARLAVEAIQAGAIDYLAKPFPPEELLHAVARCAERYRLIRENNALRARAGELYQIENIVGECPKMRELCDMIRTVAPTEARVLVLGESGTGKELVAGALHSLSNRRRERYIRINCAAISAELLESELFGHEKGAFTGAIKQKLGRVEEADEGTIFLDEIADMSRPLQAKLLRFLEDGSFTRVGGTQELRVNVRFIAATNRDIITAIREGQFREDLFHRLNVVQFRLPPLRERGQDVLVLAEHFLRQFAANIAATMRKPVRRFSPQAVQKLMAHNWPGNVRELRNVVERALILDPGAEIQAGSLPDFQLEARLRSGGTVPAVPTASGRSLDELLADHERQLINAVLEQNDHSLMRSAEQLRLSRHALRYRMQRLNMSCGTGGDDEPGGQSAKETNT